MMLSLWRKRSFSHQTATLVVVTVEIIAGDDKGKKGKVLAVFPKANKVVVEGCKMAKKAVKPSEQNQNGGFYER